MCVIVTQGDALGWYVSPRWGWRVGVPSPIRHASFEFAPSRPYLLLHFLA